MHFMHKAFVNILLCVLFSLVRFHFLYAVSSPSSAGNELPFETDIRQFISERTTLDTPEVCTNSPTTPCSDLNANCFKCKFDFSCVYGQQIQSECAVDDGAKCTGARTFHRDHVCAFCYQLPVSEYQCSNVTTCQFQSRFRTTCDVNPKTVCLGNRRFMKNVKCEFHSSYSWKTALFLSVTLGGFGVDRFYLGNWQEGIGKLFSFGGLGVWTLIDVILIATGYLKPHDGSLYV